MGVCKSRVYIPQDTPSVWQEEKLVNTFEKGCSDLLRCVELGRLVVTTCKIVLYTFCCFCCLCCCCWCWCCCCSSYDFPPCKVKLHFALQAGVTGRSSFTQLIPVPLHVLWLQHHRHSFSVLLTTLSATRGKEMTLRLLRSFDVLMEVGKGYNNHAYNNSPAENFQ